MKWTSRVKIMKVSTIIIVICLVITVIFAGMTIYGNKVGSFVVNVKKDKNIAISLSEYEDLSHQTDRLAAKGVNEQNLATITHIPKDIALGIGGKNDAENGRYLAYSFYLINNSKSSISFSFNIDILEVTKNLDSVVRVMIIENENESGEIFAKQDEPYDENLDEKFKYKKTDFLTSSRVCESKVSDLERGAHIKYTVVLWLEGWDNDATDEIKGGTIRMEMNITGV